MIHFYISILCPAILLNSFISSNNCFVESVELSTYKIVSSVNRDNFISSFPNFMPFHFFPGLTAVARTSSIIWNKSDESKHLVLFLILGGMLLAFHH